MPGNFFSHVIKRGELKHLVTIGIFEGKRSTGIEGEQDGLTKWPGVGQWTVA